MTQSAKLGLEYLQNNAANQLLANTTFATLDQLVQGAVVDKDLSAPPGSPVDGALYIVASGASGAWSGKSGQLAYWLTSLGYWSFVVPREGFLVHVNDEDLYYKYTGSAWAIFASGSGSTISSVTAACSDEGTSLTAGASKVTFRMPYAFNITEIRGSLTVAQTSGSILTVDVNVDGTSILSTKLTFDNAEKTTKTAGTPCVLTTTSLDDDAEISIDIDAVGDGTAKGLKISIIGYPA